MRFGVLAQDSTGEVVLASERRTLDAVTAGLWLTMQMQEAAVGQTMVVYTYGDSDPLPDGWPIPTGGGSAPVVYDVDAQALFDAVVTAGDTIPAGWKGPWNTFVLAAKAGGYWPHFTLLAPMLSSSLSGALVAYIAGVPTPMVNHGFVGGDYNQAQGMTSRNGEGTFNVVSWVETGMIDGTGGVSSTDCSIGAVQVTNSTINEGLVILMGSGNMLVAGEDTSGDVTTVLLGSAWTPNVLTPRGMLMACRSGDNATLYHGGVSAATTTLSDSQPYVGHVNLFCYDNSNGADEQAYGTNNVINTFFMGHAFSDAEAAQFHTDYAAFLAAIGRPAI